MDTCELLGFTAPTFLRNGRMAQVQFNRTPDGHIRLQLVSAHNLRVYRGQSVSITREAYLARPLEPVVQRDWALELLECDR